MGRKIRQVKKTALIAAEGKRDVSFLKHLKKLYHCPEVDVTIKDSFGGSPSNVVKKAMAHSYDRAYDVRYAMYDTDRGEDENNQARDLAREHGIQIHESVPNIEVTLIKILGNTNQAKRARCNSHEAKKILAQICYLGDDLDGDINFGKCLSKETLDEARVGNEWLDGLIKVFEDNAE